MSVCLSLGVSVALGNSNLPGACGEIYNSWSPQVQAWVDNQVDFIKNAPAGIMCALNVPVEIWEDITDGIIDWMDENANTITHSTQQVTPGSSGKTGFTSDTLFSFTLDHEIAVNESVDYPVSSSAIFTLSFYNAENIASRYPELDAKPDKTTLNGRVYSLRLNNGLKYVCVTHSTSDTRSFGKYGTVNYQSKEYTHTSTSDSFLIDSFALTIQPSITLFRQTDLSSTNGSRWGFYDSANQLYYYGEVNGKYGLLNIYTDQPFNGKLFDSYLELVMWLCSEADFAVDIGTVSNKDDVDEYAPPVSAPITGDSTAARQRAGSAADDATQAGADSVSVNVPTSADVMEQAVANPAIVTAADPAAVIDIPVTPVKPADLPNIDTGAPALWTTKFPFCLPFDIARLITDFSATPQIPKFSFILMPANSFGLNNEEIRVEIDFEPYDKLVKILRFFLALSFVFFLIVITRKIIS